MSDQPNIIRVFVGYDPREEVAFHVLQRSIQERSSLPVSVTQINRRQLQHVFTREKSAIESTEFSFSRFLTPWLCNYQGWAVFMDCDMIMLDDIAKLWKLREPQFAVQVAKHDYVPVSDRKFLGETQTKYEKKNWSSVMLMNCEKCTALTPEFVNTASGLELHQFKWLDNDGLIGELPKNWNHLVGEYEPQPNASLIHYTLGGPYFNEYKECEFSKEWFEEQEKLHTCVQREVV